MNYDVGKVPLIVVRRICNLIRPFIQHSQPQRVFFFAIIIRTLKLGQFIRYKIVKSDY
jgi:hypothetical protein